MSGEIQQLDAFNLHFTICLKERHYFYPQNLFFPCMASVAQNRVPGPQQFQPTVPLLMNNVLYYRALSVLGSMGAFSVPPVEVVTPQMQSQVPEYRDMGLSHLHSMDGLHPVGCGFMRVKGEEGIDLL